MPPAAAPPPAAALAEGRLGQEGAGPPRLPRARADHEGAGPADAHASGAVPALPAPLAGPSPAIGCAPSPVLQPVRAGAGTCGVGGGLPGVSPEAGGAGGAGGGCAGEDPFAALYASNHGGPPGDAEWAVTAEEAAWYGAEFDRADGDGDGYVTGAEARPILAGLGSALAKNDLRHVHAPLPPYPPTQTRDPHGSRASQRTRAERIRRAGDRRGRAERIRLVRPGLRAGRGAAHASGARGWRAPAVCTALGWLGPWDGSGALATRRRIGPSVAQVRSLRVRARGDGSGALATRRYATRRR